MPAPALSLAAGPAERRRADRETVVVTRATARGQGEHPGAAVLLDLSIYGCRLTTAADRAPGTRLLLRLEGGWPIPATVAWAEGGRMGCRFDEPIANEVMRRFTRLSRDPSSRPRAEAAP